MVLAARLWWVFDLFSHFRLQYVVAAAVLGSAALSLGAYRVTVVLALVALVHGWAIRDLWLADARSVPGGEPLRVVSANVLASNPTPEKVLDVVRASGADIVVLVDARDDRWRGVLAAMGELYPHRAPEGWRDGAPVLLFSRAPIVTARVERPAGRRPYLVAEVSAGGGVVTVAGVHPPSPTDPADSRRRNRQLDHIVTTVEDTTRPLIVAGDLNTSPWSPHFRDLLTATGLRNAAAGQGWIPTWPTWFWPALIPIDHVLVRGPLGVEDLERGPDVGSDHYPLIADLRLAADR